MRYTHHPFELIIAQMMVAPIFFDSVGARLIRNHTNFAYPYSQNQGIAVAQYDWLAVFFTADYCFSRWCFAWWNFTVHVSTSCVVAIKFVAKIGTKSRKSRCRTIFKNTCVELALDCYFGSYRNAWAGNLAEPILSLLFESAEFTIIDVHVSAQSLRLFPTLWGDCHI